MLYLASQFAWFLLAAFALGFVMGWVSQNGEKLELWSSKLVLAAGAWLMAGAVSWMQALNGLPALWLETALLFLAVYFAGCALAGALRAAMQPKALAQAAIGLDGMPTLEGAATALAGSGPDAAERAAAITATAREASTQVKQAKETFDEGKAVVDEVKSAGETVKSMLKVEDEDAIPGQRPAGLVAARAETPDDLKLIKGIGRQNEAACTGSASGISTRSRPGRLRTSNGSAVISPFPAASSVRTGSGRPRRWRPASRRSSPAGPRPERWHHRATTACTGRAMSQRSRMASSTATGRPTCSARRATESPTISLC